MTPPSAIASRKTHAKAGPEPARAVQASKCFSSRKRHFPTAEKMESRMDLSVSAEGSESGRGVRMVIPSRICYVCQPRSGTGALGVRSGAYFARGVRHSTNDLGGGCEPLAHLFDPQSGADTNDKFAVECIDHPLLGDDVLDHLWLAGEDDDVRLLRSLDVALGHDLDVRGTSKSLGQASRRLGSVDAGNKARWEPCQVLLALRERGDRGRQRDGGGEHRALRVKDAREDGDAHRSAPDNG